MLKSKTYFEQVPVEAVRRIVEAQLRQEVATDDESTNEPPSKSFAVMEEPSIADLSEFLGKES